jgi:hypothetical protein
MQNLLSLSFQLKVQNLIPFFSVESGESQTNLPRHKIIAAYVGRCFLSYVYRIPGG